MIETENNLLEEIQLINKWIAVFYAGFGNMKHSVDDLIYSTAVILDQITDSKILLNALHHASLSASYQKHKSSINWRVVHLQPVLTTEDIHDISPEVIANFDNLRIDHIQEDLHWGLREIGINHFKTKGEDNPELMAVVNIYATSSLIKNTLLQFDINLNQNPFLLDEFKKLKDPYYKARFLFHLYSLNDNKTGYSSTNINDLFNIIREIDAPNKQVRLWELCFSFINGNNLTIFLNEIENKILEIEHIENRSRAYGRIALLLPEGLSKRLFKLSIEVAGLIVDEYRKAQTLQEIRIVLPQDNELINFFEFTVNNIQDSWLRSKAYDKLDEELAVNTPNEIRGIIDANKELWAPVLLSGAISSKLKEFSQGYDMDALWRKYTESPTMDLFDTIHTIGMQSNGLILSLNAAQAIDSMLDANTTRQEFKDRIYKLLPLLSNPSIQSKRFLLLWKENLDPFLAAHAHLLSIENRNFIAEEDIAHLLFLTESNDDLSRLKSCLVFASNIWDIGKKRSILVSQAGKNVMERIAYEIIHSEKHQHFKRHALRVFFTNVIHDENQALLSWAEDASDVSSYILQQIESLSDESLLCFEELLASTNHGATVKESLFISNCKLAINKQRHVEEASFFHNWPDDMVFKNTYRDELFSILSDTFESIFSGEHNDINSQIMRARHQLNDQILSVNYLKQHTLNFSAIGESFYRFLNGIDERAIVLTEMVLQNEISEEILEYRIKFIYNWLIAELNADNQRIEVQEVLIRLLSEISKKAPNSYLIRNTENPIIELLITKFDDFPSIWVRRGCITLIGCVGEIDEQILDLYLNQSREDRDIWAATIESINKIAFVQSNVLDDLLNKLFLELENESTTRAYFASRILVSLGKNHNTGTKQKKEILKILSQVGENVLSRRNVYIFRGSGAGDEAVTIYKLVDLKTAFDQAIVEIIGLS